MKKIVLGVALGSVLTVSVVSVYSATENVRQTYQQIRFAEDEAYRRYEQSYSREDAKLFASIRADRIAYCREHQLILKGMIGCDEYVLKGG